MTKIDVYDIEAEQLSKMAEENDESIAEVVERIYLFYATAMKDIEESMQA